MKDPAWEPPEFTAHEILEQHVTNVSPPTARAITNAVAEHTNLRTLLDQLAKERSEELIARTVAPKQADLTPALEAIGSALETLSMIIREARDLLRVREPFRMQPGGVYPVTVGEGKNMRHGQIGPIMAGGGGGGGGLGSSGRATAGNGGRVEYAIDGEVTAIDDERVLITNQSDPRWNGVYVREQQAKLADQSESSQSNGSR